MTPDAADLAGNYPFQRGIFDLWKIGNNESGYNVHLQVNSN